VGGNIGARWMAPENGVVTRMTLVEKEVQGLLCKSYVRCWRTYVTRAGTVRAKALARR